MDVYNMHDARNDPDEYGAYSEIMHKAWLEFEKRLDDPAADHTVRLSFDIPIKYAALSHWRALRRKQRWAESTDPPDGEFTFVFTEEQWNAICRDLLNDLNTIYEDRYHALNNGYSALLTGLSKNEKDCKDACAQPDLPGLHDPTDPDDEIPF